MKIIITESQLQSILKEQVNSFQQLVDELVSNPVEFLKNLNENPEFKKKFVNEYNKDTENNFKLLDDAIVIYILQKQSLIGVIRDYGDNGKNEEYTIKNINDYKNLINYFRNEQSKGRKLALIIQTKIRSVKGGPEFADSANIALGQEYY